MTVKEKNQYDDIIHLSRPVSEKHIPMPLLDRAAQFSPFAALTGYDKALEETKELAVERVEHEMDGELFEDI